MLKLLCGLSGWALIRGQEPWVKSKTEIEGLITKPAATDAILKYDTQLFTVQGARYRIVDRLAKTGSSLVYTLRKLGEREGGFVLKLTNSAIGGLDHRTNVDKARCRVRIPQFEADPFLKECILLAYIGSEELGPREIAYGQISNVDYSFILMQKTGPSLGRYLAYHYRIGTPGANPHLYIFNVLQIGLHALKLLQKLHDRGIIHNDIHTGNLVFADHRVEVQDIDVSDPDSFKLILIDMGLADFIGNDGNCGSVRFSVLLPRQAINRFLLSPWQLKGIQSGKRDDIYRLGEILAKALARTGSKDFYQHVEKVEGSKYQDEVDEFFAFAQHLKEIRDIKSSNFFEKMDWLSLVPMKTQKHLSEFMKAILSIKDVSSQITYDKLIRNLESAMDLFEPELFSRASLTDPPISLKTRDRLTEFQKRIDTIKIFLSTDIVEIADGRRYQFSLQKASSSKDEDGTSSISVSDGERNYLFWYYGADKNLRGEVFDICPEAFKEFDARAISAFASANGFGRRILHAGWVDIEGEKLMGIVGTMTGPSVKEKIDIEQKKMYSVAHIFLAGIEMLKTIRAVHQYGLVLGRIDLDLFAVPMTGKGFDPVSERLILRRFDSAVYIGDFSNCPQAFRGDLWNLLQTLVDLYLTVTDPRVTLEEFLADAPAESSETPSDAEFMKYHFSKFRTELSDLGKAEIDYLELIRILDDAVL